MTEDPQTSARERKPAAEPATALVPVSFGAAAFGANADPLAAERLPFPPAGPGHMPIVRDGRSSRDDPRAVPAKPSGPRMPELAPNSVYGGELLRRIREGRGLGVRDLADRTRIGVQHIESIEADRYELLPAPVYLRGFLMLIARELKLDPLKVTKSYMELAVRGRAG